MAVTKNLNATTTGGVKWTFSKAQGLETASETVTYFGGSTLIGAGQVYTADVTLTDASINLDVVLTGVGAPDDIYGDVLAFNQLMALVVWNRSTTPGDMLKVGPILASNPLTEPWATSDGMNAIGPGGSLVIDNPLDGYDVAAGTSVIRIQYQGVSGSIRVGVAVIGSISTELEESSSSSVSSSSSTSTSSASSSSTSSSSTSSSSTSSTLHIPESSSSYSTLSDVSESSSSTAGASWSSSSSSSSKSVSSSSTSSSSTAEASWSSSSTSASSASSSSSSSESLSSKSSMSSSASTSSTAQQSWSSSSSTGLEKSSSSQSNTMSASTATSTSTEAQWFYSSSSSQSTTSTSSPPP